MLLSAVSVLVVAQPSSEVLEGLMNYPVHAHTAVIYFSFYMTNQPEMLYMNKKPK